MKMTKQGAKGKILVNKNSAKPSYSFYKLEATLNNGEKLNFKKLEGKKVLIVNTASNCGYTGQYEDLQNLYDQYKEKLIVLGFPSNDFKEQEKGSDHEIAEFCQINYGVNFPIFKKSRVLKGHNQNQVFDYLTDPSKNGWNDHQPDWNFSKYLINEEGVLSHYFGAAVSPLSQEVIKEV